MLTLVCSFVAELKEHCQGDFPAFLVKKVLKLRRISTDDKMPLEH